MHKHTHTKIKIEVHKVVKCWMCIKINGGVNHSMCKRSKIEQQQDKRKYDRTGNIEKNTLSDQLETGI